MASRLTLQTELEELLGSKYVYFQPPESVKIYYPCIIYDIDGIDTRSANGNHYLINTRYSIKLIDEDPESKFVDKLLAFKMDRANTKFNRHYVSEDLHHFVFTMNVQGGLQNE